MEIDKQKSVENARNILKKYRRHFLISGECFESSITSRYSLVPRSETNVNNPRIDNHLNRKLESEKYLRRVHEATNKMNTHRQKILYYRFMDKEELSNYEISKLIGLSESSFKKDLRKALLEFSYSFEGGLLLVEK